LWSSAPPDLDLRARSAISYSDAYNDIEAVRLHPWLLRLAAGPDRYLRAGFANRLDASVDFSPDLPDDPDQAAPHHGAAAGRELVEAGRAWDLLAVSSALDRWFSPALRAVGLGAADATRSADVA